MDNQILVTQPNQNSNKDLRDIDYSDEGQHLKNTIIKEEQDSINPNILIDNNKKDELVDVEPYIHKDIQMIKQNSDQRSGNHREYTLQGQSNRQSISIKGNQDVSARGSIKTDNGFGDKFKARLSNASSINQFGSFRGSILQKQISGNSDEPPSFAYTKGPVTYKMTKNDTEYGELVSTENRQIEKLKQRLKFFFTNFTYSGKMKFYEKPSVHRTLNDKSDGYLEKKSKFPFSWMIAQISKKINKIYLKSFLSKIPVMSEQNSLTLIMRFLFILYQSIFFILLSIILVFPNTLTGEDVLLYKITIGVWGLEVFAKLNTSTHYHSNIITSRRLIFAQYFKKQALPDFISSIFLIILIFKETTTYQFNDGWNTHVIIQILTFIKLYTLMQDLEEFQRELCMIMKRYYIVKLINLIIKLFIIAHIIACMWYIVGKIEMYYLGEGLTWQNKSIAEDQTWWKVYLLAMNWSLTLMTTSQSDGTTVLQIFFSSLIILFTTIITGYIINATGLILVEIDASEENKRNDLNIINDYMRKKSISKGLQNRVNIYIDYYYQKNYQKSFEDTKNVLSKISTELKYQMQKEYFYQILSKIDFLNRNYTTSSLQNIAIQCEEVAYYPNQIIFEENNYSDAALLIITEGTVEIYQSINQNEQKTICFLGKGNILGQINFFTGMARTACARSKGFAKVAKISRDAFMEQIKDNEKDIQTFYQMKDNILLYENYIEMNIKCTACQSFNHLQGACSQVHFNKEFAIQSSRVSNQIKQVRESHQRLKPKKFNSYKSNKQVQEKNIEFLQNVFDDSIMSESQLDDEEEEDDFGNLSSQYSIHQDQQNKNQLQSIMEQDDEEQVSLRLIGFERNPKLKGSINQQSLLKSSSGENSHQNENQKRQQNGQKYGKIQSNQILPQESIDSQNTDQITKTQTKLNHSKFDDMMKSSSNNQIGLIKNINHQDNKTHNKKNQNENYYDYIEETQFNTLNRDVSNSFNIEQSQEKVKKYSEKEIFYWSFDKQKNYDYYFNHGNAFIKLHQYKIYQKRKEQKLQQNTQIKGNQNRKSKAGRGSIFRSKVQMVSTLGSLMQNKIKNDNSNQ